MFWAWLVVTRVSDVLHVVDLVHLLKIMKVLRATYVTCVKIPDPFGCLFSWVYLIFLFVCFSAKRLPANFQRLQIGRCPGCSLERREVTTSGGTCGRSLNSGNSTEPFYFCVFCLLYIHCSYFKIIYLYACLFEMSVCEAICMLVCNSVTFGGYINVRSGGPCSAYESDLAPGCPETVAKVAIQYSKTDSVCQAAVDAQRQVELLILGSKGKAIQRVMELKLISWVSFIEDFGSQWLSIILSFCRFAFSDLKSQEYESRLTTVKAELEESALDRGLRQICKLWALVELLGCFLVSFMLLSWSFCFWCLDPFLSVLHDAWLMVNILASGKC